MVSKAARQIREIFPNLKILFLSAFDSVEVVEAAPNTGPSGYVDKVDAGGELVRLLRPSYKESGLSAAH